LHKILKIPPSLDPYSKLLDPPLLICVACTVLYTGVLLDSVETLTTGWSSPPLPAELPGPRGVPLLGYLPFLGTLPHKTLALVSQRYAGRPFRLSAGSSRFVVISRIETLRQLAGRYANQLRGKPRTFTTQQVRYALTTAAFIY